MKILTKAIERKLRAQYAATQAAEGADLHHQPVMKLFNPMGAATWLVSELDDNGLIFSLADLGLGCPELGWSSLEEITSLRLQYGLGIQRDLHFSADKTLGEYADEARIEGRIAA